MTDPLERARACLDDAARDIDALRGRMLALEQETAQARRKLETERENNRRLSQTVAQLEQRTRNAEQVADAARRAMLDHAART